MPVGNSIGSVFATLHKHLRYIIDTLSLQLERYRRAPTSDDKMQVDGPVSQFPGIGEPECPSKVPCDNDNPASDITYDCNGLSYLTSAFSDTTLVSLSPSLPPLSATEGRTTPPLSQNPNEQSDQNANRQVIQRSRWQTVLLEAGGIGAAVSEESMRRLKYCLQWLQVRALEMSIWCTLLTLSHSTPRPISTLRSSFSAILLTPFNLMLILRHQTHISPQHICAHCMTFAGTL